MSRITRSELKDISNDDLASMFYEFYNELMHYRPSHVCLDECSENFNREFLENEYVDLINYFESCKETPDGRAGLRADGWTIDFEYGDTLFYKNSLYRVEFIVSEDGYAKEYHLDPMYVTNRKPIRVSAEKINRMMYNEYR